LAQSVERGRGEKGERRREKEDGRGKMEEKNRKAKCNMKIRLFGYIVDFVFS